MLFYNDGLIHYTLSKEHSQVTAIFSPFQNYYSILATFATTIAGIPINARVNAKIWSSNNSLIDAGISKPETHAAICKGITTIDKINAKTSKPRPINKKFLALSNS
ncbi:MAG: hypothetical protein GYA23_00825 [Methanomicrobiales archaeon]|nr:hypothetical protein [Methanomicrobiales archaeon]